MSKFNAIYFGGVVGIVIGIFQHGFHLNSLIIASQDRDWET